MEHPRWEDYDYELYDDTTNDLYWLGNGQTVDEHNKTGDREYRIRIYLLSEVGLTVIYLGDAVSCVVFEKRRYTANPAVR